MIAVTYWFLIIIPINFDAARRLCSDDEAVVRRNVGHANAFAPDGNTDGSLSHASRRCELVASQFESRRVIGL